MFLPILYFLSISEVSMLIRTTYKLSLAYMGIPVHISIYKLFKVAFLGYDSLPTD